MKVDVPFPDSPPRKRRALEQAPDVHVARWLAGDALTPSERRRLEGEKERRKALSKVETRRVAVVASPAGVTPEQVAALRDALGASGASEIVHPYMPGKVHAACRATGVPVTVVGIRPDDSAWVNAREAIRDADLLIALPHEASVQSYATPGVWAMIGFAKNRSTAVQIFLPSGRPTEGEA